MPVFTGLKSDVTSRLIDNLTRTSNIQQVIPGGKARSILESFAKEISNIAELREADLRKVFLTDSYGQFLEKFGAMVGLEKYTAANAEALAEDKVFKFFTITGETFGEINGGEGFTIPSGTVITAPESVAREIMPIFSEVDAPDSIYDRSIHYSITMNVICSSADTEVFASAKALTSGGGGNLAAPMMIALHNFTGYSTHALNSLKVTNTKPVLNGINDESDDSYRYRIAKQITAAESANETAIQMAALGVPGVAAVFILPFEDGPGRFNVYIKSISTTVSDRIIEDVQQSIDRLKAVGCVGYARSPYLVGIDISSNLIYKEIYKNDIKDEIINNLTTVAGRYINSLAIGQPLILSDLAERLLRTDSRISGVGRNSITHFDSVFSHTPAKLEASGRRRGRSIRSVIEIPIFGRIVLEPTISDPIRFS